MRRHYAGDLARLLRESLGCVWGAVALVTVTQPGVFDNRTASRRWRALCARLRVEMVRRGSRSPRVVAQVCQRQRRGADHLHRIVLCRNGEERERLRLWVELYREFAPRYGFGFVDDPFFVRRRRDGSMGDMVFRSGRVAGAYLGRYVSGGQLERAVTADDRSWAVWWISPYLIRMSGWTMARCRWLRQGWRVVHGQWTRKTWYGRPSYPSWWYRPEERAWILAQLARGP